MKIPGFLMFKGNGAEFLLFFLSLFRDVLAKKHGANFTCLPTSFNAMCMLVRAAIKRQKDITPYWRVLKSVGELNKNYLGGIYLQR